MIDVRYSNPIRIYESDLTLVGELDDYASAYFTRSWFGIGDFSIQTNFNTVHATDLQKGRIVMFGKDKYRAGIITKLDKKLDENGKGGQIITASGYEIKFIFTQRIVLPQAASATYTLSNSAETVMKTLVSDQAGATADADRQFPGLTIATDADRGSTYVLNVRYNTTVADELQKISMATEVGYFIYIDEASGDFVFDIGLGTDRTATQTTNPRAIFSDDYDTIKGAKFVTSDNQYRNYAYVAGQGVGTGRTVREVYSTTAEPTGFDRKEIFVDARDLTATADLDARGGQKLGEYNIQTTVDGMPLTYSPLVYRTDYDLGDLVTVDVYDSPYDARITSVKESWAPLSYNIDIVFDKEPATLPQQVNRAIESVRANAVQTEGVIIESGSNANGKYIKYSDGTMTCWGRTTSFASGIATGGLYFGFATVTLPSAFIDTSYSVTASAGLNSVGLVWGGFCVVTSTSSVIIYKVATSNGDTGYCHWIAMGRWK